MLFVFLPSQYHSVPLTSMYLLTPQLEPSPIYEFTLLISTKIKEKNQQKSISLNIGA